MKNFKYILGVLALTLFVVGCGVETPSQDPEPVGSTDAYPTPSFTLSGGSTTFNERNEPVFTYDIVLDKPIDRPIDFYLVQIGGEAELHEDYDVIPGTVPAYQTTTQVSVVIYSDIEVEGPESLMLQVASGPSIANAYLVNPNTQFPVLDLTIQDYEFCLWTLDAFDAYGDGWQGATIVLTENGVETVYPQADFDDFDQSYEIAVGVGSEYSFTYISGSTGTDPNTGGAPGYEEENSYVLTAPDGTTFQDGPIPAVGEITSGTSSCN